MANADTRRSVRFGDARWDRAERRLWVRGEPAKLTWRVAECLSVLIEAGGEVVAKEDLQRQIWGGALVEDSNLPRCIMALRKALDPAPDGGSYIETVARLGYRLTVAVEEVEAEEPEPQSAPEPLALAAAPGSPRRHRWCGFAAALLLLVTVLSGGLFAHRRMARIEGADALLDQARKLLRQSNLKDGDRAVELIQEALGTIPDYPPAQAALAESAARLGRSSFEVSIQLARLALQGDAACNECRAVLGYVLGTRGWKWEEAGHHLAGAVQADGTQVYWRIWYAEWLAVQGRLAEALEQAQKAALVAPAEPRTHSTVASVLYLQGRYREAIQEAEKAVALNRAFQPAHYWMYRSHQQLGEDAGAIGERAFEVTAWAGAPEIAAQAFRDQYFPILERQGRAGVARAWIHEVRDGVPLRVPPLQSSHLVCLDRRLRECIG
ncbi:MAG: winged helix-turn-helix domain-containing protein [Bryobacterales bacterium]|nr:winged helix-turn-helix domain-containing protein [Bryobacterales bacterium]